MVVGKVVRYAVTTADERAILEQHAFDTAKARGKYPLSSDVLAGVVVADLGGRSNVHLWLDGNVAHYLRDVDDAALTVVL